MDNFNKGKEYIRRAVEADNKGDFKTALDNYKTGVQYFILYAKYCNDRVQQQTIQSKIEEYMTRAEVLRSAMSTPKPVAAPAGGAPGASGESKSGDGESKKLQDALSSAIVTEKPNVKWEDVAGLEMAKEALKEAVILPTRFPELFVGKRTPWRGILLYGPPGTGKSYLAKAVATEADGTFYSVSSSDLVSKWQGESERLVKQLFTMARENTPSIIFIDEVDSMGSARSDGENDSVRRLKTEFLVQMQGVGHDSENMLVLAATNTPWEIDPAMRRRFEKRIYIPLPDEKARATMVKIHLGKTPHELKESDFGEIARRTDFYSGSDISVLVRAALMEPVKTCREARQFMHVGGKYRPVDKDGPFVTACSFCHVHTSMCETPCPYNLVPCKSCGCVSCTLYDLPERSLDVPVVGMKHFLKALERSKPSVGRTELDRFEKWTSEFGECGTAGE